MDATVKLTAIEQGMPVYGADGDLLGPVEAVHTAGIAVRGHTVPAAAITRVDADGVHLLLARAAFATAQEPSAVGAVADRATHGDQLVIPVVEERLVVGTREVDLGEIMIRKRVVVEERLVPVTLRREEVEIVRREAGQPWPAGMVEDEPGVEVTRLPLRGEEPALDISQVVAREVVVERGVQAEERQAAGTVRREQIAIDEYQGGRDPER